MGKKISPFIILLLAGGMGGIVAQTILLRELLILFSGNELSIGIIIGTWVIWEAAGAIIGGLLKQKNSNNVFIMSIITFSVLFPVSIYLTRILKVLFSIPPGVGVGLLPIIYFSTLIIMPTGMLHGFFFTRSCSIYNELTDRGVTSTGKVYFYEMLGTIAGGILLSFIFIPYFNSFRISFLVILISSAACMFFIYHFSKTKTWKGTFFLAAVLTLFTIISLPFNIPEKIHKASIKKQWQQQKVIFYENSIYQNIAVIKNENQYTFFTNGIPAVTTPVPDIAFVEEFTHFSLPAHPNPRNILVIGGGAGGLINEILKYRTVKKIDYVEMDPLLLKTINRFATPLTRMELDSQYVITHYTDGKMFLNKSDDKYDAVYIGLPPPNTLQINRFYTMEFFSLTKSILNYNGIIALTMPGSLAYYNNELKELNVSVLNTLKAVFPYVFVLPGDFNLYIASLSGNIMDMSPDRLSDSLKSKDIKTNLITPSHIEYRLDTKIRDWFFSTIEGTKSSINKDFSPKGLYYNVSYQNLLFSPSLKPVFDYLKYFNIISVLCLIAFISFIVFVLRKKIRHIEIPYSIATTGFSVMLFELILIFGFQILYGYVFFEIGILITIFMTGMASGGFWLSYSPSSFNNRGFLILIITELLILVFGFLLFFMFYALGHTAFSNPVTMRIVFYFLLFISGLFAGIEFPLSNKIFFRKSVANTAGILYSSDLLGGWVGGIAGGLILIPVLGILNSCLLVVALKLSSIILLLTFSKSSIIKITC